MEKSITGHCSHIHQWYRHGQHRWFNAKAVLRCAGRAAKAASRTSVLSLAVPCLHRPKGLSARMIEMLVRKIQKLDPMEKVKGRHTCRQPLTIFPRILQKPTGFRSTAERPNQRYSK